LSVQATLRAYRLVSGRCTLDWLVIDAGYIDAFPQTENAHAQAIAEFSSIVTTLLVDGAPLALDSTAVKAIDPASTKQLFGSDMAGFWVQVGALVAPGELAVGPHTLQLTMPFVLPPKTFFIDAADSSTCG
jgi:hypothetical protein